jgi:hypothetical protein
MKNVKMFVSGSSSSPVASQIIDLEADVNAWIEQNPSMTVHAITVTPHGSATVVTVIYTT